jgi:hypothetical protein
MTEHDRNVTIAAWAKPSRNPGRTVYLSGSARSREYPPADHRDPATIGEAE